MATITIDNNNTKGQYKQKNITKTKNCSTMSKAMKKNKNNV